MSDKRKVLVVASGGLDSTTLAYDYQSLDYEVSLISFNYGQTHARELDFATLHGKLQGWQHNIIDISVMQYHLASALTGNLPVPEGHYAAETMKATIVPNRNAIMLSLACGVAVSRDIPWIATAVHGGDHFIYPDCRPAFITTLSSAFSLGNEGFTGILAPYARKDKKYIAQRAVDLNYPFNATWSCYKGGELHCGKCGTCVERMEALWNCVFKGETDDPARLDTTDEDRIEWVFPTGLYEDNHYWIKALEDAK